VFYPGYSILIRIAKAVDTTHENYLDYQFEMYKSINSRGMDKHSLYSEIDGMMLDINEGTLTNELSPAINAGVFIPGVSRSKRPNIGADQTYSN